MSDDRTYWWTSDQWAYLRALVERRCPPDVKEFGERHALPTFAEATWIAGFMDACLMMQDGRVAKELARLAPLVERQEASGGAVSLGVVRCNVAGDE